MNIVIAQSDIVTAYGWGLDATWNGLLAGKTAIKLSDRFAGRKFVSDHLAMVPGLQVAPRQSRAMAMLTPLLEKLVGKLDPQTPLILATTVGEIEYVEQAILNESENAADARPQVLLARIKKLLGLRGPAMVISSACASSATALTRSASMIRGGDASAVLVITCDSVSEFVYSGFSTLLSLCETPARPFDAGRCGLSLGEAAGWALVTREGATSTDSAPVTMLGWGSTTDAVHMTAPDRAARGLSRAIAKACKMARREAGDISFVAAHGTATIYSDAMELLAFRSQMQKPLPIFSVKGGTGHTLAAAGLVQILIAARALSRGVVPPTVGLAVPDPDAVGWATTKPIEIADGSLALSTNSGFGGVNTAIVLARTTVNGSSPVGSARRTISLPSGEMVCSADPTTCEISEHARTGTAIRAISWFCAEHYGVCVPDKLCWQKPSPAITSSDEMLALIGRPVKYFGRMTGESRACLVAASIGLKALELDNATGREIGLIAAGQEGFLNATLAYFRDYVAAGRSMGRGNLFIYTLPTSTLGEVAIALLLNGPCLHLGDDSNPVPAMVDHSRKLIESSEANSMILLFSNATAAVCLLIGAGDEVNFPADFNWNQTPTQLARDLAAKARIE